MTRFSDLLRALSQAQVEFILIGGVAAAAHGSPRATQDIDIVYARPRKNLQRVATALPPSAPALRGAPPAGPKISKPSRNWKSSVIEPRARTPKK
jgi:hypothetical protein